MKRPKLAYTPPKAVEQWVLRVVKSDNPARDKTLNVRSTQSWKSRGTKFTSYAEYSSHGAWGTAYMHWRYCATNDTDKYTVPATRPSFAIHAHGDRLYEHNQLLARYDGAKLFWVNYDNGTGAHCEGYKHTLLLVIDGTGHNVIFVDDKLMEKDPLKCPGKFFKMFDDRIASFFEGEWADNHRDQDGPQGYLEGLIEERNLFARTYGLTSPPLREDVLKHMVLHKLAV